MMATGVANIDKLNGENYATWCIQVKSLLITLDLWNAVVEEEPVGEAEKSKWVLSDSKALATITLSVKPSELIHIKSCTSAKSAWNILNSLYNANTASRKVNLFKKLVRFKINANQKFGSQINEFCSTVDDLKEIGIRLNDDLLSILLLCCLPDEMESFVVAIESRDSLPTYDRLIAKIYEEELRQGNKNNSQCETIFAANTKNSFKRNSKYNNNNNKQQPIRPKNFKHLHERDFNVNNIKCFRCGKKRHIRSQCKEIERADNVLACCLHEREINLTEKFILDSGATSHMCRTKEYFSVLTECKQQIVLASGESIFAEGVGEIKVKTQFCKLILKNVWYVPKLHSNFISINKVLKAGHSVFFGANKAIMLTKQKQKVLTAVLSKEIFIANLEIDGKMNIDNCKIESINSICDEKTVMKWHERYGHININDLSKLATKNMVKGLNIKTTKKIDCFMCALNKISAKPFKSYGSVQTTDVLQLVHTDLCGPIGVRSNKSDAFSAFTNFAANAEKQTGRKIKSMRSDNGKEYLNYNFKEYFDKNGIVHQTTVSYSPQQNGVAERANRTLIEMGRCMLQQSKLPQSLWAEAVNTAVFLRNRSPTKVLDEITPYEVWYNKKPSVNYFKIFGCDTVVLNKGIRLKIINLCLKEIK